MNKPSTFNCGFTADFLDSNKDLVYKDIGLAKLTSSDIRHNFLIRHQNPIQPASLDNLDAVVSLTPSYNADTFVGVADRLLAIVRFGVGYDMIDVDACTDAGIALFITKGAVDYSVAEATLTWMMSLSHKLTDKNRLVRDGEWVSRGNYMGSELRGKTLGLIGAGGTGSALISMVKGFAMKEILVYDPYFSDSDAESLGVQKANLSDVMSKSDYVSVHCPLNDETRDLISRKEIDSMKPEAYLINTARGGIVNESALYNALKEKRIAGAATDVFESEPARSTHPFCHLDNILLAPHCFAWTDELFTEIGHMAASAIIELSKGNIPLSMLVNHEVTNHPLFQKKLSRFQAPTPSLI